MKHICLGPKRVHQFISHSALEIWDLVEGMKSQTSNIQLKFIYSEKATKFCKISTIDLTVTKGQQISQWIFKVIVSPKIWTKKLSGFLPCVVRAEVLTIFCSYFGRNDDFMNSFGNLLTFSGHLCSLSTVFFLHWKNICHTNLTPAAIA